ncbi:MAG: CDP-alcohol phosphatidyltransferase family protein [Candidatus Methylomirabilales bacterium]
MPHASAPMDDAGRTAIVLPPTRGDWSVAAERVGGVPLLRRILVSAQRAGVRRVIICAGDAAPRLHALVRERPPESRIEWVGTEPEAVSEAVGGNGTSPCFFIRASTVLNPPLLTELRAAYHPGAPCVVPAGQGSDAPVALGSPAAPTGRPQPPIRVPLSGAAVCLDLATTTAEAAAEALYRALGRPTDSWLTPRSRSLLFPIVRALVDTPVTPNHVTLAGFVVGLGAIACLWQGDYAWTVLGGMLFVLAYLTDLLDGMLARLKLQESRWGGVMDYVLDNLVHLGIFAAIVRAVYLRHPEPTVLLVGALLLVGVIASAGIVATHVIRPRRPVNRLLAQLTHRDFALIVLLAALVDRLEGFLWAAAIGINLFWPSALALLIRDRRAERQEHPETAAHLAPRPVSADREA